MARWLTPQDYGAFSVAFAIFLLIGVFHTALLTEPMLVFGPGRYKDRFSGYLGALLYGHLGFAALSSLLLLLAGLGLALSGLSEISEVLLALAFAGPFIFLLWLMRRACYVLLEPRLAALGGALYMTLMVAGAYALYRLEWLSAALALGVMGFSSLVVSLWLIVYLHAAPPSLRGSSLTRDSLESHWRYGRWSVATSVLTWAPGNIYYLLLPTWGGLEAAASLRALMNLIMPMLQGIAALGIILMPALVRARGRARFGSLVRFALVFFVLGPALYWVLLGILNRPLVAWLYGGQYTENAHLLWLLGLLPIASGVIAVVSGALRALERPDRVFWAYALSTAAALTLGVGLMYVWEVAGAVLGLLFSYGVTAAMLLFLYSSSEDLTLVQGGRDDADVKQSF